MGFLRPKHYWKSHNSQFCAPVPGETFIEFERQTMMTVLIIEDDKNYDDDDDGADDGDYKEIEDDN